MTFFFENSYWTNRPPYNIFFYAKMCRNVQTILGINLGPSLVKALTHPNFPTAPQTKNRNNFFLSTSQKIDAFIDFFLIKILLHLLLLD